MSEDPATSVIDDQNQVGSDHWKNRSAGWAATAAKGLSTDDTLNQRLIEHLNIRPCEQVLDLALVACPAGRADDAQVHRVLEAPPGEPAIGRGDAESERGLYRGRAPEAALAELEPVLTREELLMEMASVSTVGLGEPLIDYTHAIVSATREHDAVALGVSPRAAMSWLRAARARARLEQRDYVLPDDLKALARPVLGHRVLLKGGGDARPILDEILASVPVPI